jgi:hypothetical protein
MQKAFDKTREDEAQRWVVGDCCGADFELQRIRPAVMTASGRNAAVRPVQGMTGFRPFETIAVRLVTDRPRPIVFSNGSYVDGHMWTYMDPARLQQPA